MHENGILGESESKLGRLYHQVTGAVVREGRLIDHIAAWSLQLYMWADKGVHKRP